MGPASPRCNQGKVSGTSIRVRVIQSGGRPIRTDIFGTPLLWKDPVVYAPRAFIDPSGQPQKAAQYLSPSPPLLMREDDSTESSNTQSSSSSSELSSPPTTATSTIAVLGSAGMDRNFEDDYDRPEANPNFVRYFLRRSRSLRRQARMRDGDFRDTDEELDYSVTTEGIHAVVTIPVDATAVHAAEAVEANTNTAPMVLQCSVHGDFADDEPRVYTRTGMQPSRLSQRVTPPPPINTQKQTLRNGARYEASYASRYEIQGEDIEEEPHSGDTESGFEADDEGGIAVGETVGEFAHAQIGPVRELTQQKQELSTSVTPPGKKSYAAVLASPPQASKQASRVTVSSLRPAVKHSDTNKAFGWQPFVELLDV